MPTYEIILLDLDGTVLDFSQSERYAFFAAMEYLHIPATEEDYRRYTTINSALWLALERGEISSEKLRIERFQRLLSVHGQWDWAEINRVYADSLAQIGVAYPGAVELLAALHERYRICALTNGILRSQRTRILQSGLAPYIDRMVTSEEAGAAKPSAKIFNMAMEVMKNRDPRRYIMVGDSLTADVQGAFNVGIDSIWYTRQDEEVQNLPTFKVCSYSEIAHILLYEY